jgi:hypothetical protein
LYRSSYFSNSACILRQEAVSRWPMRDLPYAEENAFALDLVLDGRRLEYCDYLAVYYEAPVSPNRLYEQSRRQIIAEKLMEERYGPAFNRSRSDRRTTFLAFVNGALIPATLLEIAYRMLTVPRYAIGSRPLGYDICALKGVWGRVIGALTWRRFGRTIEVDAERLAEAHRLTRELQS